MAMTDLPDDILVGSREFRTAESTLGSEDQPLTWPALSAPLVLPFALVVLNALIQRGVAIRRMPKVAWGAATLIFAMLRLPLGLHI